MSVNRVEPTRKRLRKPQQNKINQATANIYNQYQNVPNSRLANTNTKNPYARGVTPRRNVQLNYEQQQFLEKTQQMRNQMDLERQTV